MNRRSFLKAGALSVGVPAAGESANSGIQDSTTPMGSVNGGQLGQQELPPIPDSRDLASHKLVYGYSEIFSPPPAQNEWGYCQATRSVSGITTILFPPFACCGAPSIPTPGGEISPGALITCDLFLDGRLLSSYLQPESKVSYKWYPHCVERETQVKGIHFTTQMYVPSKVRVVAEIITVKNVSGEHRKVMLGFDLRGGVTYKGPPWYVGGPAEHDNRLTAHPSYIVFESIHTRAISIQGITPQPDRIEQGRILTYEFALNPGEERVFHYANSIGDDFNAVLEAYNHQQADSRQALESNEAVWNARIWAAFTPGNSEFSGSLPQLVTRDPDLWKIYYAGFLDVFLSRRIPPAAVYSPAYLTVPRDTPTLSYVWDTALTSLGMALLDPAALRIMLETWFVAGMDQHYDIDYLSGNPAGPYYSANDMGILKCAHDYLRVTGDFEWLDKIIDVKSVMAHLTGWAVRWKQLDKFGHGLADYGNIDNLLEAVITYTHEVAAINAGNVFGMRFLADLLELRGDSGSASAFRQDARNLAERINRLLYVKGKGWWRCGQPDGSFVEVRHCFDLLTVLDMMCEDLSAEQKKEMVVFFWDELHTPLWMHALSPGDADASWKPGATRGLRSDHTWIGAYIAWPPMTARGLYKIDAPSRVAAWVKNFAKTANQGTFGQAHFVDTTFPLDTGGVRKDPAGGLYEIAGGSFMTLMIDAIFGADLTLNQGIQINSHLGDFDPSAKLLNLGYQGKTYEVSAKGAKALP
jgi:hypothetical protein